MRFTRVCFGYFKKYVDREVAKATGVLVETPVQGWRFKRIIPNYHFTEDRPWTEAAKNANRPRIKRPKLYLEPIKEWTIFLGDRAKSSTRSVCTSSHKMAEPNAAPGQEGIQEGILLGIGNPLLDISVYGDETILEKYNLKADNAILAESQHDELFRDLVENYQPEYLPGGATQNSIRVAQWLLQKPKATSFIGAVGDDDFGRILREVGQRIGVDVVYEVVPKEETGVCAAVITNEDRSLVSKLGAAKMLNLDFVTRPDIWSYVERAKYFYIGGYVLPVCPDAVKKVLEHAAANDKTVVMNLHATYLCEYFVNKDLNILPYVDVIVGNGPEARKLAEGLGMGTQVTPEIALKTCALPKANSKRGRIVVFTQGRKPVFMAHDGTVSEHTICPLDTALIKDTNGCGDAFVGGYLSQLVQGKPLEDCIRYGLYASKVVIQHFGCTYPTVPDFE